MVGTIMILLVHICSINIQLNHGKVTLPKHGGDVKKGTLHSILKQAGLHRMEEIL